MPYSSITDLPPAVRSRYSDRCQGVFLKAFNVAQKNGTSEADSMKVAHTAAGMCKGAGKADDLEPGVFIDGHKVADRIYGETLHYNGVTVADSKPYVSLKATVLDDDKFSLLAIPFGGPIPAPLAPKGVDLDGEWFSESTDIKAAWFDVRLVDWHHGGDRTLGRTVIGKADNLHMEEDGWWVDVWLKHGEQRLALIKRLAERGAQLYGSSESVPGMVKKASTGEILVWPYVRQTLSTSPQNTHSVIRPAKAVLDGATPTEAFWSDVAALKALASDPILSSLAAGSGLQLAGDGRSEAGAVAAAMADFEQNMDRLAALSRSRSDSSDRT